MGNVTKVVGRIGVAVSLAALSACASHPLGISDDEWQLMSMEEQLSAAQRQVALDDAARLKRAQRRRDLALRKMRGSFNPDKVRAQYYDDIHFTDILLADCLLQGDIKDYDGWERAFPNHFRVRAGFANKITISSWDRRLHHTAHVKFDGNELLICPSELDFHILSDNCADIYRSPKWTVGGETLDVAVRDTWRGTAQCHMAQPAPKR